MFNTESRNLLNLSVQNALDCISENFNLKNLSVTIKLLTRYQQTVVLAAKLEGKSIPSNMAANTNHTTLLKNQCLSSQIPDAR